MYTHTFVVNVKNKRTINIKFSLVVIFEEEYIGVHTKILKVF